MSDTELNAMVSRVVAAARMYPHLHAVRDDTVMLVAEVRRLKSIVEPKPSPPDAPYSGILAGAPKRIEMPGGATT